MTKPIKVEDYSGFVIDIQKRSIEWYLRGKPHYSGYDDWSPQQWAVLSTLARDKGKRITKQVRLDDNTILDGDRLSKTIQRIRRRLPRHWSIITAVPGIGYTLNQSARRLSVQVRWGDEEAETPNDRALIALRRIWRELEPIRDLLEDT